MKAGGDQAGEVGHVNHQVGVDEVGDASELGEVELPRVGRPSRDDHLGAMLECESLDLRHVDAEVDGVDVVGDDVVQLAAVVEPHAVGEVPAVREVQAKDGVARVEQREHGRGVGLSTRVRLDVGVPGAEEFLDARDGQALDRVDVLAPTVVAAPGVSLGVLVG